MNASPGEKPTPTVRPARRCRSISISVAMSKWCGQQSTSPAPRVCRRVGAARSRRRRTSARARAGPRSRSKRPPRASAARKLVFRVDERASRAARVAWTAPDAQRSASASVRPAARAPARGVAHPADTASGLPRAAPPGTAVCRGACVRRARAASRPRSSPCGRYRRRGRERSRRPRRSPGPPNAPARARRAARAAPPVPSGSQPIPTIATSRIPHVVRLVVCPSRRGTVDIDR